MNKKKHILICLAAAILMSWPVTVYADEVTNFEDWTPDGNGGYTNSAGQSGSDGSSNVHVNDEGSGKSESNSTTTESGSIINTETDKQSSVTITTTNTENNTETMDKVTNGQMVPTVEKESGEGENTGNSNNSNSQSNDNSGKDNSGDLENPKKPNNPGDNSGSPNAGNQPGSSGDESDSSKDIQNGKPNNPFIPGTPEQNKGDHDYGTHWGIATAETIEDVIVDDNGKWTVTFKYEDGTVSQMSFDTAEDFTFVLTGVKDEMGNDTRKEYKFRRSDELEEWIFKYFSWRAVNITYKTSSYYGTGKIVAKTTKSSAVFTLTEAGKYRVLATPYHDVRHYHIYEWEDDDGSHSEEVTDYWEYDRTKSPDVYSVVVPIITDDGKPIKVCINGGCDCGSDLNAVCDEVNEPEFEIDNRVELEK